MTEKQSDARDEAQALPRRFFTSAFGLLVIIVVIATSTQAWWVAVGAGLVSIALLLWFLSDRQRQLKA